MPDWKTEIRRRLQVTRMDPAREVEVIEEMANHLEDRYQEFCRGGASASEARRKALAEFDEREQPSPEPAPVSPVRRVRAGADLWRDLRYGLRMLRQRPGFTAVIVLTLGLGIGANTTVFTIINTVLLNPLPVADPSRLVGVFTLEKTSGSSAGRLLALSYPNLEDLRKRNEVFSGLAGYTPTVSLTLSTAAAPQRIFAELVTANYFDTLGLQPVRGRFFLPEEDRTPGAHPVAVVGYESWQERFGADPAIIGRTIRLNDRVFTIVGVAPPGFKGVNAVFGPDLWLPAMMAPQVLPIRMRDALIERQELAFQGVARLRPGIDRKTAEANLKTLAAALENQYPDVNRGRTAGVRSLTETAIGDTARMVTFSTAVLMGIVGLVLLIACSNVANLLLARAASRRQEIAVRLALGASRGRLVRQLLTESLMLGACGGALGLAIGYEGCHLLWSFRPADVAQNFVEPKLDGTVLLFTLLISLLTGLVFGIVPAMRSSRADVADALKEEARTAGRSRRRVTLSNALLVGQVALSLVSLITASLFLRSIQRAYLIDPGFQTNRLAIFLMNPGQSGYSQPRIQQFYRDVRSRVSSLPDVASVSWASNLPLWGRLARGITIEGREEQRKNDTVATIANTVDLDYFSTAGIPLLRGRTFTGADRDVSVPVAIVNETLAQRYWPNQDPLGKRLRFSGDTDLREVVGVVKTADYQSLGEPPQPCIYLPLAQNFSDSMTLYVRTTADPTTILKPVQAEVHALDPNLDVNDVRTGRRIIDQALFGAKMGVGLLGVFGALALGLACVGLYGILVYSVNQRRREIGLRMALGAGGGSVLRLVLRQGLTLVAVGILSGLAVSFLAGRALSAHLYGVSPEDPLSLGTASLLLFTVAIAACYLPARAASRVDPLVALRDE